MGLLERLSRSHMSKQIADPELLAKVLPDYAIGCKRVVPSNRWYPTLARPNVELVAGGLRGSHAALSRERDRRSRGKWTR